MAGDAGGGFCRQSVAGGDPGRLRSPRRARAARIPIRRWTEPAPPTATAVVKATACAGARTGRSDDGPPALHGIDRGVRSAQGFRRYTREVGLALRVSVPVMSSTPEGQVPRLRTAAERERHDVVDLQPIAGAAAPAAVRVDIAATTLVAPPHFPPHGSGDVPGPGARHRAEAAQRGEVPLQRWRVLHRPHRAVPGCVRQPLRRRSRKPAAAPHWCPRRVASAGFELQSGRASCTVHDTVRPRGPAIAVGAPLPLRQRSSPTAATTHRLRLPA